MGDVRHSAVWSRSAGDDSFKGIPQLGCTDIMYLDAFRGLQSPGSHRDVASDTHGQQRLAHDCTQTQHVVCSRLRVYICICSARAHCVATSGYVWRPN